jgi:shikimate kinase
MKNIVLIGMPASGKSTVGVLLAKRLGLNFLDTDLVIQQHEKRPLAELLDRRNPAGFRALEERHVLGINVTGHVMATGGSVIYGEQAMHHLRRGGIVVYLDTPLALLEMRIADLVTRAVVMHPSQTLRDLYEERDPLYRRFADLAIDCLGRDHEAVATAVKDGIQPFLNREMIR